MSSLTFTNVDRLCAGVDLRGQPAVVDLSGVTFVEPFALIYLGMFLRYHRSQGRRFSVHVPSVQGVRDYLTRQRFWKRFNFDLRSPGLPPDMLRRMTSTTSLNDVIDIERRSGAAEEVADAVVQVLHRASVQVDLGAVNEMVGELVDNFVQHSRGPLAAFMMQWFPRLDRLELAIGDCGVGIRRSLARNPNYAGVAARPHDEAAALALKPGVTGNVGGGGTGLTEVCDTVRSLGGGMRLSTGDGYVWIHQQGSYRGRMSFDLPGVQVEIFVPARR